MRLIGKILFLLFALSLLVSGATLAYFKSWRTQRIERLNHYSQVVDTAMEKVEYAEEGQGPAVLIFHAAPGGYDQALLLGSNLAKNGFRIIAPSRPGYLRTPLDGHITPEEQADVFAALLDKLGVQKVAVMGFSMGCPTAIQFMLRYPDRVWGGVLVSAIFRGYYASGSLEHGLVGEFFLTQGYGDIQSWLLLQESNRSPAAGMERLLSYEKKMGEQKKIRVINAAMKNREQLAWYQGLLSTTSPWSVRERGFANDSVQVRSVPPLRDKGPFDPITAPLLAISGAEDIDMPATAMKEALASVPNAQFLAVEDAAALVWLGPNAKLVDDTILAFLKSHAPAAQ